MNRLRTHPLADDEANVGSGPVRELDQRHQVLVIHHMICRFKQTRTDSTVYDIDWHLLMLMLLSD